MEYSIACNFTMFRYIDKNILCYYNSLYIRLGIYLGIYVLCHENNYNLLIIIFCNNFRLCLAYEVRLD